MGVSVIILNWNGRALLAQCLPSVIAAARQYPREECVISVVDNGSSDGSGEYLAREFPAVKLLALPENLGFAQALNRGIAASAHRRVILLNNDVTVDADFIAPLAAHFSRDDMFCAGARMLFPGGKRVYFGRASGTFRYGFFLRRLSDPPLSCPSLYGCGGGMMVDRDKFLALGGFDEDMEIYWEDLDLCYRAWKRGWATVYEPQSRMIHRVSATNSAAWGAGGIAARSGRNYLFFIIKNIHDRMFIASQVCALPLLLLLLFLSGRGAFCGGVISAIAGARAFLRKRAALRAEAVLTDRQILAVTSAQQR